MRITICLELLPYMTLEPFSIELVYATTLVLAIYLNRLKLGKYECQQNLGIPFQNNNSWELSKYFCEIIFGLFYSKFLNYGTNEIIYWLGNKNFQFINCDYTTKSGSENSTVYYFPKNFGSHWPWLPV